MGRTRRTYPDADPSLTYDLAKNELSILLSSVDALDNKITFGVSLATGLIALLLAFIGIRTGQDAEIISAWSVVLIAGTAGVYLAALLLFGLAFWRSTWEIGLTARDAWDQAGSYKDFPRALYWWAAEMFIDSLEHNHRQYRRKQDLTTLAFALLALQLAVGAASIVITFR